MEGIYKVTERKSRNFFSSVKSCKSEIVTWSGRVGGGNGTGDNDDQKRVTEVLRWDRRQSPGKGNGKGGKGNRQEEWRVKLSVKGSLRRSGDNMFVR